MICSNCGAEFDEKLASCPYCGQLSPPGAELAHMEKLRTLREATEHLGDIPEESYKAELKAQGKRLLITLLITAGVIAVLLFLVMR